MTVLVIPKPLFIMILKFVGCQMAYNGPAIKGGCATRRKHRAGNRNILTFKAF